MKGARAKGRQTREGRELWAHFRTLHNQFGPQSWWPAKTRLEVILGAILTQNTSWRNAELALKNLRRAGLLRHANLRRLPDGAIASYIRPSGFFRQKARTIRGFLDWLDNRCAGSLDKLFTMPPESARKALLDLTGIGPETADAILLYAGKHPFFVADAYTRRVLSRHGLIHERASYYAAQTFIHQNFECDYRLYNEYHALIVEVSKSYCVKSAPKCCDCPLEPFLPSPSRS